LLVKEAIIFERSTIILQFTII